MCETRSPTSYAIITETTRQHRDSAIPTPVPTPFPPDASQVRQRTNGPAQPRYEKFPNKERSKTMHILAHFMIYAGLTAAYIGAVLGYI